MLANSLTIPLLILVPLLLGALVLMLGLYMPPFLDRLLTEAANQLGGLS